VTPQKPKATPEKKDGEKTPDEKASPKTAHDLVSALEDPHTSAFLKAYLAISDEELKAHIRRLVEETRVPPKPDPKGGA